MKKNVLVDQKSTPEGKKISLYSHDGDYSIFVDGNELMTTRQHYSEEVLADVVLRKHLSQRASVLVGGLGFGYTLAQTLKLVDQSSQVTVVELMECVVDWNRDEELPLASVALKDPRVTVLLKDVGRVIRSSSKRFDAIMLDVDNGPEAFTLQSNDSLYSRVGLEQIRAALRPGGTLGVWSSSACKPFEKLMQKVGFQVEVVKTKARPGNKGATHYLFVGRHVR